jgi:hypothetical protein
MGSMLRNFAETPLHPFRGPEHDDKGGSKTSKSGGRHVISLALKVRYQQVHIRVWFDSRKETCSNAFPCDAGAGG